MVYIEPYDFTDYESSDSKTTEQSDSKTKSDSFFSQEAGGESSSRKKAGGLSENSFDDSEDTSFRNTIFDFLTRSPDFTEAYMYLEGVHSSNKSESWKLRDLLLVIRPSTFPEIEAIVFPKGSTQVLEILTFKYRRGFHLPNRAAGMVV